MAGRTARKVKSDEPVPMPEALDHEDVLEAEVSPPKKPDGHPAIVAAPEHSHPGESASNGLSEKSIQTFEDQFRTFKAALEANLNQHLPNDHPVWSIPGMTVFCVLWDILHGLGCHFV